MPNMQLFSTGRFVAKQQQLLQIKGVSCPHRTGEGMSRRPPGQKIFSPQSLSTAHFLPLLPVVFDLFFPTWQKPCI